MRMSSVHGRQLPTDTPASGETEDSGASYRLIRAQHVDRRDVGVVHLRDDKGLGCTVVPHSANRQWGNENEARAHTSPQ